MQIWHKQGMNCHAKIWRLRNPTEHSRAEMAQCSCHNLRYRGLPFLSLHQKKKKKKHQACISQKTVRNSNKSQPLILAGAGEIRSQVGKISLVHAVNYIFIMYFKMCQRIESYFKCFYHKTQSKELNKIQGGDGYFYFDNADGITGVCICTNLLKHTYQRCTTFCMYQLYLPIKIDDRQIDRDGTHTFHPQIYLLLIISVRYFFRSLVNFISLG